MTVIAVAQQKGGVGKTTLSICVAGEYSRRNHDVVLVDSDPQRSASQWAEPGNLDFAVHEISLQDISVSTWARAVRDIDADIVVIDTAPSERQLGAAIALADLVLVPCTASGLDVAATERTIQIINSTRKYRRSPLAVILVPNRIDRRTLEGQQLEDELHHFGEFVGPAIGSRASFIRAFAVGESIATMARGTLADQEIKMLVDRTTEQLLRMQRRGDSPGK